MQKNLNTKIIAFKVVWMKFIAMHMTVVEMQCGGEKSTEKKHTQVKVPLPSKKLSVSRVKVFVQKTTWVRVKE